MGGGIWNALAELSTRDLIFFGMAITIAFAFEFINGFHDTANAVTTVIYTRTMKPTPAVLFSGVCNFLGVLLGGTAIAFSIVHLLPVDLLIESGGARAVVMVISLLLAGVIWNLATWWLGLPVSSSHTLIGSILGVGLAHSLMSRGDMSGVNWDKAAEVGLSLLISPVVGFALAAGLLLGMKRLLREPRLYHPPEESDRPPRWVRGVLVSTCAGVSFAHGSNDGQKGMGLILLVLIGFLPGHYALNMADDDQAKRLRVAALSVRKGLEAENVLDDRRRADLDKVVALLEGTTRFQELAMSDRWRLRQVLVRLQEDLADWSADRPDPTALESEVAEMRRVTEYVPLWVIVGVAVALGVGTTIGYRRIVHTVAEKIGRTHLTYAQGAAAEVVAAMTIGLADRFHLPVSTTHVLSSGVAGTMWANRSGLQGETVRRIGLAWVLTMPAAVLLAAGLFWTGNQVIESGDSQTAWMSPSGQVSQPGDPFPGLAGSVPTFSEASLKRPVPPESVRIR